MTDSLTVAEHTKFALLSHGISIAADAQKYIDDRNDSRAMTPADYASTSGIILAVEDDVWVNAPIATHNANFVGTPEYELTVDRDALVVRGPGVDISAKFWLPPAYHGASNHAGVEFNSLAVTHTDRVRISPIEGCAMTCKFCDLPYEFRYRTKSVADLVDSVREARDDRIQPAAHVLISGGTPRAADFDYLREVYERVIATFPDLPVDVMMVPLGEVLDVKWLAGLGVNELSINLEIYNTEIARSMMRRKFDQGRDHYLDFLESAAELLGARRVRSMLMVGLEPMEDTLAGVDAIAARGCVPVLSPFRPDPSTPLHAMTPPTQAYMEETYLRALEVAHSHDLPLGPSCIPCTHNTLTLASSHSGDASQRFGNPVVV